MANSELNLSSLNGSNGFIINGIDDRDQAGFSVSSAGDINGDGFDDVVIGANEASPSNNRSGQSYVVFGNGDSNTSSLDPLSLNGSNGFIVNGIDGADRSGIAVNNAGDVNGDGIDDLIIGAHWAGPNGKDFGGESYVVFGSSNPFPSSLTLSSLDGTNGFILNGKDADDQSGRSVSSAGDVNGDGIDDLIIGAPYADPNGDRSGESYVVFGSNTPFTSSLELSNLDGTNGFTISGIDRGDGLGNSVSSAGDVNGDGIDDLIIGASKVDTIGISVDDPKFNNAGQSYVVFGSSSPFSSSLALSSLDGTNGFTITGIDPFDFSGTSVSGAGDVNGDGFDDLIIGATGAAPDGKQSAGESYVVFGSSNPFAREIKLSSLDGNNGFVINGINVSHISGASVNGAGDVNGDGIDDLIIGAIGANPSGNNSGQSYVVFGSRKPFNRSLELFYLDGSNGFKINGVDADDFAGISVSGAGDINGDGLDDLIIGAFRADPNGKSSGASYVVFGSLNLQGTSGNDIFTGSSKHEAYYGLAGNDTIEGGAGADCLHGGADRDTLRYTESNEGVIIGLYDNSARGGHATGDVISDFEDIEGSRFSDILAGDSTANRFSGNDGNDLLYGLTGNDYLTGGAGNDYLIGGAGADTLNGNAGIDTLYYTSSIAGVNISLNGNSARGGYADGDVISNFERVQGSNFADILVGNVESNILNGHNGSDILYGLSGNDALMGGAGNDYLIGGKDNDLLTGGANTDTFTFSPDFGIDTITDFQTGLDRVRLSGFSIGNLDSNNDGILDVSDTRFNLAGSSLQLSLTSVNGGVITFSGVSRLNATDILA